MKVTKSMINKVLKENFCFSFVKMTDTDPNNGFASKEVCYTDYWDNKRVKGIRVSSRGPLSITNAWIEAREENTAKVKDVLIDLGLILSDAEDVLVTPDGKIKMRLSIEEFPQYTRRSNFDNGYINVFLAPRYI